MNTIKTNADNLFKAAGSLIMAGLPGYDLDKDTEQLIMEYAPGGIILFSRNIKSPEQVAELINNLQQLSLKYNGCNLFIAVDQEGGPVARLRDPFREFPGNEIMSKSSDPIKSCEEFAKITAHEMKLAGFNMNMAPVLDVPDKNTDAVLAGRTFGSDPNLTAILGRVIIRTLQDNGIIAVAKHFPGLGATSVDHHKDLPLMEISEQELESVHIYPFAQAIEEKVAGIMTSHGVYPAYDSANLATTSPYILTEILRKKYSYGGLILTDDLEMGAIKGKCPEAAIASVEAGADILLICKDQSLVRESIEAIYSKLEINTDFAEKVRASSEKIKITKEYFNINQRVALDPAEIKKYFYS